jgi:hypothetical protein
MSSMNLKFDQLGSYYEKHVLVGLNQIYYWLIRCTTCYHYTNIFTSGLINLIKIGNVFTTEKGLA